MTSSVFHSPYYFRSSQFLFSSTADGCYRLPKMERVVVCCLATKSSLTLLQSHGLQPARLLCPWDFPGKKTGGISFSRGSSQSSDETCISCIGRWSNYHWSIRESPVNLLEWPKSKTLHLQMLTSMQNVKKGTLVHYWWDYKTQLLWKTVWWFVSHLQRKISFKSHLLRKKLQMITEDNFLKAI